MDDVSTKVSDDEALDFHARGKPGKLEITPTKPMATQRDLSLAYSPGVAAPVHAIARDPNLAYDYTSKGNMVAVISNGTAILGLGDLGALASKPVMEGKSVLFKRFADIDSIDLEVDTKDPEAFINCVRYLGPAFGGINLEDIAAPESFYIEQRLKELMDIPVFHDDQHGTAIIAAAGLINALDIAGKSIRDVTIAVSGAGSSALSVISLIKSMGLPHENALVCDSKGVLHKGRTLDQWRSAHAVDTDKRTLAEAMAGADVFIGLSVGGVVSQAMVKSMAKRPIIFAMANPNPEILPEEIAAARSDAIIATGRSDYPNQVNNVLGFPYIFRGALDVRARTINEEMKLAAAHALAELAREDVPDEVALAYGARPVFGPDYIIPVPFDPRLISYIPPFVAQAAMDTGVARKPITNMQAYREALAQRLDPAAGFLQRIHGAVRESPKRIVFAEGEEPAVIRAAYAFHAQGLGKAILIGRDEQIRRNFALVGIDEDEINNIEICNARLSDHTPEYTEYVYKRLQRKGFLHRDAQRFVNQDRNIFSACMVAHGHADGIVTGITRNYDAVLQDLSRIADPVPGEKPMGISVVIARGRTIFVADTNVAELPDEIDLARIAMQAAATARRFGHVPRVAFLSFSNFGNPPGERVEKVREAVALLDRRREERGDVDFEYEGEMNVDVALNPDARQLYPFCRLTEAANVLIMPGAHSASISTKMLATLGWGTVTGPILNGLSIPVQICNLGATVSEIVNMAAIAAYDLDRGAGQGRARDHGL